MVNLLSVIGAAQATFKSAPWRWPTHESVAGGDREATRLP